MLFVKSKPTVTIDTDLGKYECGVLSVIGLQGIDAFNQEVREYVFKYWGYNKDKSVKEDDEKKWARNTRKDKRERDAAWTFLLVQGVPVMMCDVGNLFDCASLIKLADDKPEQIDACYKAALRQNPKLAPVGWVDEEAEKTQAESESEAAEKN